MPDRGFSKKIGLTHIYILASNTYIVSEKTNKPIPQKLPERRTDKKMDRLKEKGKMVKWQNQVWIIYLPYQNLTDFLEVD